MNTVSGAKYLLMGFRLILRPGLRRFVLIPLAVNIVVFAGLIWLSADQFGNLLNWMLPSGEGFWFPLARSVLWILFAAATLLIAFFTFTLVANLIGSPFNSLLSEKAETLLTGRRRTDASGGLKAVLGEIGPTLRNELLKLLYFVAWVIGLFLVSFVPVVNLLSPLLWFVFGAWMLALEYLGYPMENHGLRFKDIRHQVASRRMLSMSFGAAALVATMVPVLNFLVMPAAVAGATALWVDHWREPPAAAPDPVPPSTRES